MKINRYKFWLFFFIWAVLIALAVFFHADHFLNGDEGVTLNGAWNLYNGRKLYFDFFSFLPPLSFFLLSWLWQVVGVSFWSAKIFSILLLLLGAFGLYRIAARLRVGAVNLFVPSLFIIISSWWWIINHNFYQLIATIWLVYCLLIYEKKPRLYLAAVAGLLAAVSILLLQQKGLIIAVAAFLFLLFVIWRSKVKARWSTIIIYLLSVSLPLIALLLWWPLSLLWQNLVIFPLFHYIESNRIPYYLFILALLSWLLFLFGLKVIDRRRALLLGFSLALIISSYPLPDYYHLSLALVFLLPLLPDLLISVKRWHRYCRLGALAGLSWLLIWPVSVFFTFLLFNFSFTHDYPFLDYIRRECPGNYLQSGPFLPNVYFETRKLSATAFDILITGHQTPDQFVLAGQQLAAILPTCAVTAYPQSLERFKHNSDNQVDNFIREHYQPVFWEGPITVWRYQN